MGQNLQYAAAQLGGQMPPKVNATIHSTLEIVESMLRQANARLGQLNNRVGVPSPLMPPSPIQPDTTSISVSERAGLLQRIVDDIFKEIGRLEEAVG